jgi:hypothetical protein
MKLFWKIVLVAGLIAAPIAAMGAAKPSFIYGVWLPFWQSQSGAQDISLNLDSLNEVSPFSYEIVAGGAILDDLKINNGSWDAWFSSIRDLGIKNIPTIAWFDTNGIYNLLSSAKQRQAEENAVAALVRQRGFDGIDIDFEAMPPATQPYYSLFIQGLAERLHPAKKLLTCTVVPRTPPSSLYATPPTTIIYPENYTVLNTYCDEVRLMAYDQGPIDLQLDASRGNGVLYAPVADPAWVTKVIAQATASISPKKIMLGIPTYGYEYEVSWQNGATTYKRVRSFTYLGAMDRIDDISATVYRNNAGEQSFTFASSTYIKVGPVLTSVVSSTEPKELISLNSGNIDGTASTTLFFVSYPDATSAATEIALAKKLGLKGAIFFKADGLLDPMTWQVMK